MAKHTEGRKIPYSLSLTDVALHALRHISLRSCRCRLELKARLTEADATGLGLLLDLIMLQPDTRSEFAIAILAAA